MSTRIPRIIHQSWKSHDVPKRWLAYQESWKRYHPDFEYRFWTDDDNRAFVEEEFPDWLEIYDNYSTPISRADLARCLVVSKFGGIYADMDFEALRSISPLLEGRSVIFGLEPISHLRRPSIQARGFTRLVCNALFASTPEHPFWDHLLPMMRKSAKGDNPLDVAGPFIVTEAVESYPNQQELSIVEPPLLYPLDNYGVWIDPDEGIRPFAVHHWAGTWWRDAILQKALDRIRTARNQGPTSEADPATL